LPDTRERLAGGGFEPVASTPAAFAALIRNDMTRWSKLIRDAGIKPEAAQ
jgi:tripartite-type tricarboxylate transporter receptor subunit TctC